MKKSANLIRIDLASQQLHLISEGETIKSYSVSTALKGPGEGQGSECTPRGLHRIRLKIGAGAPENAVFVGRRPTGEIFSPELAQRFPARD